MLFFVPLNSFLWPSFISRFVQAFFFLSLLVSFSILYFLWHLKEFRLKFIFLFIFWLILFFLFFIGYDQLYSLKLDGLLEERTLVLDPQQFVALLYYQAFFWANFLLVPIFLCFLILYFCSSLTPQILIPVKILFVLGFRLQLLTFILVYRWIFPDWLLSISLKNIGDEVYIFEPNRFYITEGFFTERFDFLLFTFFLNLFYCLFTKKFFSSLRKQKRLLLLTSFLIITSILFYQNSFSLFHRCLYFIIFDFIGFRVYAFIRLNLWKSKTFCSN